MIRLYKTKAFTSLNIGAKFWSKGTEFIKQSSNTGLTTQGGQVFYFSSKDMVQI